MWAVLALSAFETILNQWIDLDAATRHGMDQLHGKLLRVVIDAPQLSVDVLFDRGRVRLSPTALGMGERPQYSLFEQRPYDRAHAPIAATTALHVANLIELARLIGASAGSTGNIPLQGDMALLQQLQQILAQAEPDIAAKLAPWIGDVAAHQIGQLLQHSQNTLHRSQHVMRTHGQEWLKEDSRLLAARWQVERFIEGVRDLRTDVERAAARVAALEQQSTEQQSTQPPRVGLE